MEPVKQEPIAPIGSKVFVGQPRGERRIVVLVSEGDTDAPPVGATVLVGVRHDGSFAVFAWDAPPGGGPDQSSGQVQAVFDQVGDGKPFVRAQAAQVEDDREYLNRLFTRCSCVAIEKVDRK